MAISFDYKLMLRLFFKSLGAGRDSPARLSCKRIAVLLIVSPAYLMLELVNWTCLLLDEILFRGYRSVDITEPVFILGVPRSGTTFFHRLLSHDRERFTSMQLWEIMFAPSVLQKKLLCAWANIDRRIGGPAAALLGSLEKYLFRNLEHMHGSGLREPEEDEMLLLHIFSTCFLVAFFPFPEDMEPFLKFDDLLSPADRARIMTFYKRCVQRHLYVFGRGRQFLSKNPLLTSKLRSVNESFPDARAVYMLRSPLEVIPSLISLSAQLYHSFASPPDPYPLRDFTCELLAYWYRDCLAHLDQWPAERHCVIEYSALMQDPFGAVSRLYEQFGFSLSDDFRTVLEQARRRAGSYKSRHAYSLEAIGLTRDQLLQDYGDLFKRFDFGDGSASEAAKSS